MPQDTSMGHQTRWAIQGGASPRTFNSSSERYAISSDTVRKNGSLFFSTGLRGTRGRNVVQSRFGINAYGGVWTLEPSIAFLNRFLYRAMGGGTELSGAYSLAETLPEFDYMRDIMGASAVTTYRFNDCAIDSIILRGASGGPLMMQLAVSPLSRTTGASFPAASFPTTLPANHEPVMVSDLVITLAGSTRYIQDFELGLYNNIRKPYRNSQEPRANNLGQRIITFNTSTPFTSTEFSALTGQAKDGAAATMVFTSTTDANASCTLSHRRFQYPDQDPIVSGPDEILLPLDGFISGEGSNAELTAAVTLDS